MEKEKYILEYMRVGDEDRQLTQKEIKKIIFKVEEKNNKWEEKTSTISLDNIDEETIKDFIKKGNENGRINFKYTNKENVLKKLNLIDSNGKIKNAGYVLSGKFEREDIPEVPIRAMREILCNSFCHRDWNEPYDNYLAIYKNRIEICNPGFFTEEATPEDYIKNHQDQEIH